jgi:DNA-binding MarR family transcriptional regulator
MQTQASAADQIEVARALERVIAWLRQSREPTGLSASALSALSRLDALGSLRVTELAELEQLTQPGMTTLIHRLEGAGLATREADPSDRRAVRVTITAAGVERVIQYRDARASRLLTRINQLSDDQQSALSAALPALRAFAADPTDQDDKQGNRQ